VHHQRHKGDDGGGGGDNDNDNVMMIIIIIIMTETEPISKTWVDMNHLTGLSAQDFNTFSPVASSKYYDSTGASLTKYATAFLT
jgi:hypothetical protein